MSECSVLELVQVCGRKQKGDGAEENMMVVHCCSACGALLSETDKRPEFSRARLVRRDSSMHRPEPATRSVYLDS
jgi:hypothetical protein